VSRRCVAIAAHVLTAFLLACGQASADSATAEELFRVARRLLASGQIAEACSNFEESHRLDPSSGTLLSLADCHARLGRTASAWAEFLEAERLSLAQKRPDRAREARAQADALEPQLSRLLIRVPEPAPEMVVERNGERLALSSLGVSLPVDPGEYSVRVSASGYVPWTHTLAIHEPGEQVLDVPSLTRGEPAVAREQQRSGSATAPRKRPQEPRTARNHRPIAKSEGTSPIPTSFWVAGGTGVVAAGLVAVFGGLSLSSYAKAEDSCPGRRDCSDSALDARDRAGTQARIANISAAVAIIASGTAAFLYFDSRGKRPRQSAVSRSVRPRVELSRTR
jgi:tetratricopeptide (TPR) repeat protein